MISRPTRAEVARAPFAAVLATGMAAGTAVQFLIGVLGPYLVQAFDVPRSRLGFLMTVAFFAGGVSSPALGRLTDRAGGRTVFVGSLASLGAAVLAMAAAPAFEALLLAAAFSGIALAAANPCTNKLIAQHLPAGARGVVTGVKQAGVQVGAFLIGFGLPPLAERYGWRAAMAAATLLPAAAIAGALAVIPPDESQRPRDTPGPGGRLGSEAWWMTSYAFFMGGGVAVIGTYLPLYAKEEAAFSTPAAGAVAGSIGAVGVASRIVWGWAAERRGSFARPLAAMAAGAAAGVGLVLAAPWLGPGALWAAAVMFGATAVSWNAVGMLAIVSGFDSADAGTASGRVLAGFYAGFVATPVIFGHVVDVTGSYVWSWTATSFVFSLAAGVAVGWQAQGSRRERRGT